MTAAPLDKDGLRQVLRTFADNAGAANDYEAESLPEAVDAIMQLAEEYARNVAEEVIGEDEPEMIGNTHMVTATSNNKLRAEQRKRLEDRLSGK